MDSDAMHVVREVANRLRSLSREAEEPLGVYTLRGGMPKDDGWARTPDQPLILASTVDQLGSRLLVQGYGVSKGMRPVHAGLLGNDLLLLLDEVHLSQPFAETLGQLDRLRGRFALSSPLAPRFQHAFLSATPGATNDQPFRLTEAEESPESPLGPRLHASKPCRLLEITDRAALEEACTKETSDLIGRHQVVAVVLNRVSSASKVVQRLRGVLGDRAEVVLLTGRMRPLDRDDVLRALRSRIMTGRDRSHQDAKLVVVGTQCIEAGADFDFDALVTESASFDALRQRFGRLDRLGLYGRAEGVIIHDKSVKEDPVYGKAVSRTIAWLKEGQPKKKELNFGILALPQPSDDVLSEMLAPKAHAPILLPAYLDLWMQTSPEPAVAPDVALWLHGPSSGPPDVQVVWRVDLIEGDLAQAVRAKEGDAARTKLTAIVASVRPSSLEAISLPYAAARNWLCGIDTGEIVDAEGTGFEPGEVRAAKLVLRWNGDDSEVIRTNDIRPGDTLVVPAVRGGIRDGCFDPSATSQVEDLAERASLFGRGLPVLRLHARVLDQLALSLPADDTVEARSLLHDLAQQAEMDDWRQIWLGALAKGRGSILVDASDPWSVLIGARIPPARLRELIQPEESAERGIELTTDDDDSFHAGYPCTLARHSADVEQFASAYATQLLPRELATDLALAAWLHDIGKADRRFQILLRGGSEIEYFKDERPWAKSGMAPGAKTAHRLAQRSSRYPKGARHEVQSVAMIEQRLEAIQGQAHDIDLVLHLVASHHGHCRPFAPVVLDESPIDVELSNHRSERFGQVDFGPISSKHELHRLDSPLADRFWGLVEKYGWQELCWLEAILRLADHRASEMAQESGDVTWTDRLSRV